MPINTKYKVCIRLDRDVLNWFQRDGEGYQTRINEALKEFIARHDSFEHVEHYNKDIPL